jgi:hypothetical protein
MARTEQAIVKRYIVFVRKGIEGGATTQYNRRPYDVVEYNWGDGNKETYLQPHFGQSRSASETEELYDGIRIYDTFPDWDFISRQ